MKYTLVMFIISILFCELARANSKAKMPQTQSTSSLDNLEDIKTTYKRLKDSRYKMNVSNSHNFYSVEDGKGNYKYFREDVQITNPTLQMNINRHNDIRLGATVFSITDERASTDHQFRNAEFRYRRNRILTEDTNYVNMSAEIRNAYVVDEKRRAGTGIDGFLRPQINFSKNFSSVFSIDLSLIAFINIKNTDEKSRANSVNNADQQYRILFSPNYAFLDIYTFSPAVTYVKGVVGKDNYLKGRGGYNYMTQEQLWFDPNLNIVLNSVLNIDIDWWMPVANSHPEDNGKRKTFQWHIERQWGYGLTFNVAVF